MNALLWMALAAAAPLDSRVDAVFQEYDRPDSPGCAVGVYRDGNDLDGPNAQPALGEAVVA